MENNNVLKLVYTFFLGLLIAGFVGVGVSTFYPGPSMPEYPITITTPAKDPNQQDTKSQLEYDAKVKNYNQDSKSYNRNVSIVALISSVILLALSVLTEKKIRIISDGVMLGGLFTLAYSIGRSFASNNNKYVFLVITVGLAVVIYLGYHRFVRPNTLKKA